MAGAAAAGEPARSEQGSRGKIEHDFDERCSLGTCPEARSPPQEPPRSLGPPLKRDEISTEIRKVESDVGACGRAVDASGTIAVRLVVRVDGRISAAVVTGRLADTPLAICVERALKSIRFRGNDGISLTYPFFFKANASIPDCGGIGDGSSRKVDAAAMQHFSTMLGRCAGARAATVPVRLAMDEKGMIRAAEAQRPYAGTREGFCVERVLACVVGSFAARLPPAWEIGLEAGTRSAAKLRPIHP